MTKTPPKNKGGSPLNNFDVHSLTSDQLAAIPPEKLGGSALHQLGHYKRPTLSAIRWKCFDCSGCNWLEVEKCVSIGCPLGPYRMGKNPFRKREGKDA